MTHDEIMENKKKEKVVTVGCRYQRTLFADYKVPFIRISGKWLKELGFGIGDQLKINVEKHIITLTPSHALNVGTEIDT